jgi:hypothetical protein
MVPRWTAGIIINLPFAGVDQGVMDALTMPKYSQPHPNGRPCQHTSAIQRAGLPSYQDTMQVVRVMDAAARC